MKKLYIHDDGTVLCTDHAGFQLRTVMDQAPNQKIYWTPLGTWEFAAPDYYAEFASHTGMKLDCEECSPIMERALS